MSMRLRDRIAECVSMLRGDPRSSLMSGLAIALAVAAFVIVTSIADGMTRSIGRQFESLGTRTLLIGSASTARVAFRPGPRELMIARGVPGVSRAALSMQIGGNAGVVEAEGARHVAAIHAVSADYFEIDRLPLARGALPRARHREALIGASLAKRLFDDPAPLGRYLRIGGQSFVVSGVLPESDEPGKFAATDEAVYLPLSAAAMLPGSAQARGRLVVEAEAGVTIEELQRELLRRLIDAGAGRFAQGDLVATGRTQLLEGSRRVMTQQSRIASWISALAMAIAALGVMNMMFLGSARRRAEIGLRRAVGASRAEIMRQFLSEALLLCLMAIPVGMVVGRVAADGVRIVFSLQSPAVLSLPTMALASIVAITLVLAFSLAPAWQAAKTDPATALRSE